MIEGENFTGIKFYRVVLVIEGDGRSHSKLSIERSQRAPNRIGDMIGSKAGRGYLVEQWQESLKVMAINNGYMSVFTQGFCRGHAAKATTQDNNARFCHSFPLFSGSSFAEQGCSLLFIP
jgi:hypothetical protein